MNIADGFLLLGAGASRDGKVPTAQEFIPEIRSHLAALPSPHSNAILPEFDAVVEKLGGPLSLEPFFEAIDDSLDAHHQGLPSAGGIIASRAIERIHYETKRVIQERCAVRDLSRAQYLDPLMALLRLQRNYPIASLNYDSMIELACARNGLSFFEAVVDGDGKDNDKRPLEDKNIRLVKVHGSVTWLPTADGKAIARNGQYESAIMRQAGELRSAVLETPLIYPSRKKMPIHAPFMKNSLELQELFCTKPFCVAVGYSFPDLHLRSWLERGIKDNKEFTLFVVGPIEGNPVFQNLISNLPNIPWTKCLRVVGLRFADALKQGFEKCLETAVPFGPSLLMRPNRSLVSQDLPSICNIRASGLGASSDGQALYVSDPQSNTIQAVDLDSSRQSCVASNLKNPRGISVAPDGTIFVVQNRLVRWSGIPTVGAGTVVQIDPDARRRTLTKYRFKSLISLLSALARGDKWSELRGRFDSILSWPTDVAVRPSDGKIFATEARALVQVRAGHTPVRVCRPPLAFNLHGVDVADDGALVAVEQGVGQTFSWGRVERFVITDQAITIERCAAAEGLTRLMAICFITSRRLVAISQTLSWPQGAILLVDYPGLGNARVLHGFDFPQKLAYIPKRDLLAVGTPAGVKLISVADLDHAVPLDGGRSWPFA